jgi:Flp pilus assembly protein TadG
MIARLKQLRRARDGAAAMEMVLITPVVAGLLFAALDFSGAWLTRLQLEQAAQRGIEAASAQRNVQSSYAYALTEATTAWGKPYTSAVLDAWLECGGVRQANVTTSCNGAQRARYVSIVIRAEYVPSFGWGKFFDGSTANNGFIVTGDATVRLQ